jgi:CRP-like cAMP-binding protein
MPAHFELFNTFITKYVEFNDDELTNFSSKCTKVEFPKSAFIMKAGEVQKNLYFITEGIIRNYIENNKGEIKIFNFRSESMVVTGYASYNYEDNLKSLVNVQCLEDCVLIKVPFDAINYVINHIKLGDRLGRYMAEAHVERLENIDKNFPNIHQRVPQYMIASYLGITPVHLSNLKKKRKPSKN